MKEKHLEFIQINIQRLSNKSSNCKNWTLVLVTGILTLEINNLNFDIFLLSIIPIINFWLLNAYYLKQERLFRCLYDNVRKVKDNEVDFNMNLKKFENKVPNMLNTMFSITLLMFYIPLILSSFLLSVIYT